LMKAGEFEHIMWMLCSASISLILNHLSALFLSCSTSSLDSCFGYLVVRLTGN